MKVLLCYVWVLLIVSNYALLGDLTQRKIDEGYPTGFSPDCPGAEKNTSVPLKLLKHLLFVVYGADNSRKRYNYFNAENMFKNPAINFRRRTAMYIGGFTDSSVFPLAENFGKVYAKIGYNVILLDINRFTTYRYPIAVSLARYIATKTAEVLVRLRQIGLKSSDIELVGLSLGAHFASYVAKTYRQHTGDTISRITGLDPAGPCYRNLPSNERLEKSDADFVEVIHTNVDGFGMPTLMGHVDIYVNGGEYQPGEILIIPCLTVCSHLRSFMLWLSIIAHPKSFIAMRCGSIQEARDHMCFDRTPQATTLVGLATDRNVNGLFYLSTDKEYPYYLGLDGLRKEKRVLIYDLAVPGDNLVVT